MAIFVARNARARSRETVLFIGSSTIANWASLQKDFPLIHPINYGIGGTTYADLYRFCLLPLKKYRPSQVVVYSGDNDLAAGLSPDQVARDFSRSIDRIHALLPNAEIIVINIKPAPGRWNLVDRVRATNRRIHQIASRTPYLTYVDVYSKMLDRGGQVRAELFDPADEMHIHLNPAGYELWSSIVRRQVLPVHASCNSTLANETHSRD